MLANDQLRAALTDTAVPGPARRAVVLDLLDGKVSPAARRLAAFACRGGRRARGRRRARLGQHPGAPPRRGPGRRAGLEPDAVPPAGRRASPRRCTRTCPPPSSSRSRTTSSASPGSSPPRRPSAPRCPTATSTWRHARAWSRSCWRARCRRPRLALVRYAVTGGRARDFVGTLDFLVELTAQARGWRIARVRAAAPIDDAQRTELTDSLGTLAGAPVELQVEVDESLLSGALDPHRRPAGGRHGAGAHRRPARALRPGRLGAGRIRPGAQFDRIRQREQSDGRAHDRRQ